MTNAVSSQDKNIRFVITTPGDGRVHITAYRRRDMLALNEVTPDQAVEMALDLLKAAVEVKTRQSR